eukprot:2845897-Pyramimonas_sp.AAC.1
MRRRRRKRRRMKGMRMNGMRKAIRTCSHWRLPGRRMRRGANVTPRFEKQCCDGGVARGATCYASLCRDRRSRNRMQCNATQDCVGSVSSAKRAGMRPRVP